MPILLASDLFKNAVIVPWWSGARLQLSTYYRNPERQLNSPPWKSRLVAIHDALREAFDLASIRQWSVESTPNDLTAEKLYTLLRLGVTRISLGVQSLDARQLRRSGRGV